MSNQIKKIITIESCFKCPYYGKCKAWNKLTKKQRFTLLTGVGIGEFILKDCHLENK